MRSLDPRQLFLPGFATPFAPPKTTHSARVSIAFEPTQPLNNLFLAILPDENVRPRIHQIAWNSRATHRLSGIPFRRSRFHVTLHSLGAFRSVPPGLASKVGEIFAPIAASMSPFAMGVDRALSFNTKAAKLPFVLRDSGNNDALMDFYRRLGAALDKSRKTFTPHITLLYDPKRIDEHPVGPVSWVVHELVLVRSWVGQGRHEHLARWPLHS